MQDVAEVPIRVPVNHALEPDMIEVRVSSVSGFENDARNLFDGKWDTFWESDERQWSSPSRDQCACAAAEGGGCGHLHTFHSVRLRTVCTHFNSALVVCASGTSLDL